MNRVKQTIIKNYTYHFYDDMISMKTFDPDNIKIDEMSYKSILINYIRCMAIKRQLKINSVNPL